MRLAFCFAVVVSLTIAGCGKSSLDVAVGDYNAELEVLAKLSQEEEEAYEYARTMPDSMARRFWDQIGERVTKKSQATQREIDKLGKMRKAIESDPSFRQRYRYSKFVQVNPFGNVYANRAGLSPFRYAEMK
ncbi:MAG: hypothetical protein JSS65_03440 [Armatimonadetes bacterium]|nr:hypothetical protein [Armatimonadota bacterium]